METNTTVAPITTTAPIDDDTQGALPTGLKAGWKTSEFWVTLAMIAGAALLFSKGQDTHATVLLTLAGTGYKTIRTIQKIKAGA
jgi:hypothetical protein